MTTFNYVATDVDGKSVKGEREASTEESLRLELLALNLAVERIKEKKPLLQVELSPQRVKQAEIMHFSRQIAAFVRSGISITDALDVVRDGTENKRWKQIVGEMHDNIEAGVPFAETVAEHASLFPAYYLGIVRSAELTGRLDEALDQLSEYMERDLEARHKITSALIYPAVVAVFSIGTVALMATFVLPKFVKFFKQLHAKLPLPTRMLLGVAAFFKNFWYVTPLVFVLLVAAVIWMRRSEQGRTFRDRLMLRLPAVKGVVQYSVVERFARILGAMVGSGVSLPEAMMGAIAAANNRVFAHKLRDAHERMLEGEGLAGPIEQAGFFPSAAVQMIRVGENTGTLEHQLENISDYYGRELEFRLKRLTSLFEPAVIVFMGFIVGFVAVALITAMYGVFQGGKIH
ncbi:MAG TPA: type II secretion system F family protein [Acidimicrobiia bacterium]